ncbi:hypothetical protein D3C86_2231260 [compost metagenome]
MARPTVRVCSFGLVMVNTSGRMYSFHAPRKVNKAVTARAGRSKGRMIRKNTE